MKTSTDRDTVTRNAPIDRATIECADSWRWPEGTFVNLVLLTVVSVVFFLPIFLHPTQMLWGSDLARMHAEYRQVQWRSFHVWHAFPLWDPTIFGGKSIVGDTLPALLNPLGMVFWLVWAPAFFGFYLWIATTLSSWGMFLYARLKGCTAVGALAAAVIFALSGKTAAHLFAGHVELLSTALGLPWLLWGVERLMQRPRWGNVALLGLMLALVATFGSVQIVYWHILFLILYVAVVSASTDTRSWRRQAILNELWLVAALIVFAAAAAIWWFPVVRQTLLLSARTGSIGPGFSAMGSLPPHELLRFVWPFLDTPLPRTFVGDTELHFFWETTAYPGVAALTLALMAVILFWRRRSIRPLFFLAVFTVLLALGRYSLVYIFAYMLVPGFHLFRAPGRMLFYTNVLVALLAGLALSRKEEEKPSKLLVGIPLVLWLPVCFASAAMSMDNTVPERGLWVPLLVLSALSVGSLFRVSRKLSRTQWQCGCLVVIAGELLYLWYPHVQVVDPNDALPPRSAAAFMADQGDAGTFRYYDPTGYIEQQDAARYGLETIDGYHPGIYVHQLELYKRIWREDTSSIVELVRHPVQEAACSTILDVLNVRYALSTDPIASPDYIEVFRTPPSEGAPLRYVYRRTASLPRAWLVGQADTPAEGLSVPDALCGLNPREACLVEDRPVAGTAAYRELSLDRRAPGNVTLRFTSEAPGVAVLSESWHPDWRATDNGKPIEVRKVNHGIIGIPVGAGEHVVHVYYYPWDFYAGALVSAITLAVIFAAGLTVRLRAKLSRKLSHTPRSA